MRGPGPGATWRRVREVMQRSLWLSAAWTGVGAALVCAVTAIIAVALCWLPVSGSSGRALTVLRAGLLTFLTALHGGVTLDGVKVAWLPLGMLLAVGLVARRAGLVLVDAAAAHGEREPHRLMLAAWLQAACFAATALAAVPVARVGTSSAPFLAVGAAALLVFGASGGVTVVCAGPMRDRFRRALPRAAVDGARAGGAALLVVLAGAALLVAGSLVVHRGTVEALSRGLGPGWNGVPVLLVGLLAAPNALVAGAGYLVGAGFAVGDATSVSPFGTRSGTVPDFPLLGALPAGARPNILTLALLGLTLFVAAVATGRVVSRATESWLRALRTLALAALFAGVVGAVLAWQAGGALGPGSLSAVGVSPWRFAAALMALAGVGGAAAYALGRALTAVRGSAGSAQAQPLRPHLVMAPALALVEDDTALETTGPLPVVVAATDGGHEHGGDELAG